ncbi:MAG: hypothetical protein V4700_00740 [Pseudomonadota bacterium]
MAEKNNLSQWSILLTEEFNRFTARLEAEFKKVDIELVSDESELNNLKSCYKDISDGFEKSTEKSTAVNIKEIEDFLVSLDKIDELIREKIVNTTPLKPLIEKLKSVFCRILNFLLGEGFPVLVAEGGVYISSQDPEDYRFPKKPLSEHSQIFRSFFKSEERKTEVKALQSDNVEALTY